MEYSYIPCIVKVLPEPVCPYAKTVNIPLLKISSKIGSIEQLYNSYVDSFSLKALSNLKEFSSKYLVIPSTFNF